MYSWQRSEYYWSRWFVLPFSILCMLGSGSSYAFGVYSDNLKDRLNWDQSQISNLALASSLGGYIPLAGFVFDRFGPKPTIVVGAILVFLGYFMLWLVATKAVTSYAVGFVGNLIWSNGASFFDTAALATSVQNFPNQRGLAIGVMKGFLALGSGIMTELYFSIFRPDPSPFILFLGVVFAVTTLMCAPFLNVLPAEITAAQDKRDGDAKRRLLHGYAIVLMLALYLLGIGVVSAIKGSSNVPNNTHVVLVVPLLLIIALFALLPRQTGEWRLRRQDYITDADTDTDTEVPLHEEEMVKLEAKAEKLKQEKAQTEVANDAAFHLNVPLLGGGQFKAQKYSTLRTRISSVFGRGDPEERKRRSKKTRITFVDAMGESAAMFTVSEPVDDSDSAEGAGDEVEVVDSQHPLSDSHLQPKALRIGDDMTVCQAMTTVEFWLLTYLTMTCVAAGLTVIYNLGQYVPTLGGSADDSALFVSFLSIANSCGRMAMGLLSEYVKRLTRPLYICVVAAVTCCAMIYLTLASDAMVALPGIFLVGLGYGSFFVLQPAITAELFGTQHFGALYTVLGVSPIVSSICIANVMSASVYDHNKVAGDKKCHGKDCYHVTFICILALSLTALIAAAYLFYRTRDLYARLRAKAEALALKK